MTDAEARDTAIVDALIRLGQELAVVMERPRRQSDREPSFPRARPCATSMELPPVVPDEAGACGGVSA